MNVIDKVYIDGAFVTTHGEELFDLYNPTTGKVTGRVRLADAVDARLAIAAAKRAFVAFSKTPLEERIAMLRRLNAAVGAKAEELGKVSVAEFGGPSSGAAYRSMLAANSFVEAIETIETYPFERMIRAAKVIMQPVGVVGLITPWNNNNGFICSKLAMAIAAGCTAVIKPSEMSAGQTQLLTACLHEAGLPPGAFNIITGKGDVVGAEMMASPDIAKISFTGSTAVGKSILRASADTMKRVTLRAWWQIADDHS